jgi:hypothetical protein
VITLVLSLADALRSRFAFSPLGEAVLLSRAMALPSVFARGTSATWLRRHDLARRRLQREHDLRALLALMAAGRRYFPDFLTQTDESAIGGIERELEEIRATPEITSARFTIPASSSERASDDTVRRRSRNTHASIEGGHDVDERAQR